MRGQIYSKEEAFHTCLVSLLTADVHYNQKKDRIALWFTEWINAQSTEFRRHLEKQDWENPSYLGMLVYTFTREKPRKKVWWRPYRKKNSTSTCADTLVFRGGNIARTISETYRQAEKTGTVLLHPACRLKGFCFLIKSIIITIYHPGPAISLFIFFKVL